jgi:hypothetical protein
MKKAICILLCSFITLSGFAQTASRDVVLLLDTSASMSDYYLEVRDYLSDSFLREFLSLGDTFHLISFSDRTRLEISRRVDGQSDIETIVGRLLLMYPLDSYSDIVSALRFAERYITSLSGSRAKSLVFISDGDNNPAPGTRLESANIQSLIAETATRLNRSGVSFEFIPIPRGSRPRLSSPSAPAQGSAVQAPSITSSVSDTQAPSASRPATVPSVSGTQASTTPLVSDTQAPSASRPATVPSVSGTQASTTPLVSDTQAPSASRPATAPPVSGTQASTTPLVSDTQAPSASRPAIAPPVPPQAEPVQEPESLAIETGAFPTVTPREEVLAPAPEKSSQPIKWPGITLPTLSIPTDALFFAVIGTGGLMLLAITALTLLTVTRLHNAPNRIIGAVAKQALLSAENVSDTMPPMLSLFVKDQPTTHGKQNLHILQPGHSLSLGGDESDDFVVSIVTIPRRIACVRFDGQHYTFIPRKLHSLPDIGSTTVQDCVGKEIRVVHKNFEVYLSIEQRENPLRGLGKFLRSFNSY